MIIPGEDYKRQAIHELRAQVQGAQDANARLVARVASLELENAELREVLNGHG